MTAREKQKVAVVTGANRGIGLEIARQLAEKGVHVVMTARDRKKGEAAAQELRARKLDVEFMPVDVTEPGTIAALAAALEKKFGGVDILVNNAGILPDPKGAKVMNEHVDTFRAALETNTLGPLMLAQALAPLMKKRGGGRIVNLSSGLGQLEDMGSGTPAYRMSKTALNALTRMLAAELAEHHIKVNSMCPGWVRTDMGGENATRPVEEGADTAVWLALLPKSGPTGGFFRDRKPIPW
ncbi:MAG TPA: SDR family oxidoreductase [Pelomicrobium sp.]|nr:SDR family oxidoreductase [Pelomicrobium sp.]